MVSGIEDNSGSFGVRYPYDIPGEDWLCWCGGGWCSDPTLTFTCTKDREVYRYINLQIY